MLANNVALVGVDGRIKPAAWSDKQLASLAGMAQVCFQLRRIAAGRNPAPGVSPQLALIADQFEKSRALLRYSRWLATRNTDNPTEMPLVCAAPRTLSNHQER